MRKEITIIFIVLLSLLTACNTEQNKERVILTNISGELNDVLVVMANSSWKTNSGKLLKSVLQE